MAFEEIRSVHFFASSFDLVEVFVKVPRIVPCQFFLVLRVAQRIEFWRGKQYCVPYSSRFFIRTKVRFLKKKRPSRRIRNSELYRWCCVHLGAQLYLIRVANFHPFETFAQNVLLLVYVSKRKGALYIVSLVCSPRSELSVISTEKWIRRTEGASNRNVCLSSWKCLFLSCR